MAILTLSEFKTSKNIQVSTYDAQIEMLAGMVEDAVEKYCGRKFGEAEYEETHEGVTDARGFYLFICNILPVKEIASVKIRYYGTATDLTVDVSKLDLFKSDGCAYYAYATDPSVSVIREEYRDNFYYTIKYTGGYAEIPAGVKFAVLDALSTTFKYYFNDRITDCATEVPAGEVTNMSLGDYSITRESSNDLLKTQLNANTGIVLTQTVKDLLRPYKVMGQSLM